MDKEQFEEIIAMIREHKSVIEVVLKWSNGHITAPVAMEQIRYILTDNLKGSISND